MIDRTVAQKLQIKSGDSIAIVGATDDEIALLHPFPDGTSLADTPNAAIAIVYVRNREQLLAQLARILPSSGGVRALWVCYPKGGRADLNRDTIMRETGAFGWRPISNVSIDEVWSAVRVRPLQPGEAPVG